MSASYIVMPAPIICAQWAPANTPAICDAQGTVLASVAPWTTNAQAELLASALEMRAAFRRVNEIIYARGAPLGSADYFELRGLAVKWGKL